MENHLIELYINILHQNSHSLSNVLCHQDNHIRRVKFRELFQRIFAGMFDSRKTCNYCFKNRGSTEQLVSNSNLRQVKEDCLPRVSSVCYLYLSASVALKIPYKSTKGKNSQPLPVSLLLCTWRTAITTTIAITTNAATPTAIIISVLDDLITSNLNSF